MAVALGASVYIWDASSGNIVHLVTMETPSEYMSAVKWIQQGSILAVGNSLGHVEVGMISQLSSCLMPVTFANISKPCK